MKIQTIILICFLLALSQCSKNKVSKKAKSVWLDKLFDSHAVLIKNTQNAEYFLGAFRVFDQNRDGFLSGTEFAEFYSMQIASYYPLFYEESVQSYGDQASATVFKMADVNIDGKVSKNELRDLFVFVARFQDAVTETQEQPEEYA